MIKVLGVAGSPRAGGNSDAILKEVLRGAREAGASVEAVQLREYDCRPCVGCERCRRDKICTKLFDGMQLLYPKIIDSKGLVLVSPTHNYNVTAWVKAFIDRLYCFYDFTNDRPRVYSSRLAGQGRLAVVASVAEQPDEREMGVVMEALRLPLEPLGYQVIDEIKVWNVFDRGKVKELPAVMKKCRMAGRRLAELLKG